MIEIIFDIFLFLVRGLLIGSIYGLLGLGLSICLGVMRFPHLGYGQLCILSAYLSFVCINLFGLDPLVSLIIVVPIMMLTGYLLQRYLVNYILRSGISNVVVGTFSIGVIVENLLLNFFTANDRSLTPPYLFGCINFFGIPIPFSYFLSIISVFFALIILSLIVYRTLLGKAIRAVPLDNEAARILGIEPEKINSYAFMLSMFVGSISGIMLGIIFSFTPYSGRDYLFLALGVSLIGGRGKFLFNVIGGILLGIVMSLAGYFVGSRSQMLVCYLFILISLYITSMIGRID